MRYVRVRILLSGGLLALISTMGFYKSSSTGQAHHNAVLGDLRELRRLQAELNEELLTSRSFASPSYDPLVKVMDELNAVVQNLKLPARGFYEAGNAELDREVDAMVSSLEAKSALLDRFKSRNAILRNSTYYLPTALSEIEASVPSLRVDSARLVREVFQYSLLSSTESRMAAGALIDRLAVAARKSKADGRARMDGLLRHARIVLSDKDELDQVIQRIIHDDRDDRNHEEDPLERAYMRDFAAAERDARLFRLAVYVFSLLMAFWVMYALFKLSASASKLREANANLEHRVDERTQELRRSMGLVADQQKSLAQSAKMSALGEMAGGVAHEINNPLAVIKTVASQLQEVLGDEPLDRPLAVEMATKIERTTDRIGKIVASLRSFSRDGSKDAFAEIDARALIEDTMSFCSERLKSRGVRLIIEAAPTAIRFEGRATELSQVLLNLLNNACDAVSELDDKWIRVSLRVHGPELEIRVTDSGSGVPKEFRDRIFEPFFTTKGLGKGTGLGLSISVGIIRGHQGQLSIDAADPNTCFTIRIPMRAGASSKAA